MSIDPKLIHELEQSRSILVEELPRIWWGLYEKCKAQGFNEIQAMTLVKTYVYSQNAQNNI